MEPNLNYLSSPAHVAETHVSYVFFVGDRAYKLKKSVRTGFLDFSTVELRRRACEREVELNRRFAPDVYLGVATVLGPGGDICDHLVVMKRMPEDKKLSVMSADDLPDSLRKVTRQIVAFHAKAETSIQIASAANFVAVCAKWDKNISELRDAAKPTLSPFQIDEIDRHGRDFLAGRRALFDSRADRGFVRDCHGDLLAEDIFMLEDGPRILDCLEFDDHLRYVDVIDDVACLAMDVERLKGSAAAQDLIRFYREYSADTAPDALVDFYMAYRALVRSKVACLKVRQGDADAATDARRLASIAQRHVNLAVPRLVMIGGLPGSGKSTLASKLADLEGWAVIRSDDTRRELVEGFKGPSITAYKTGTYSEEFTTATYDAMLHRADKLLAHGVSVVLDASWVDSKQRQKARFLGVTARARVFELHLSVTFTEAARRIKQRREAGDLRSDATPEIARRMGMDEDPWPEAVQLESSADPSEVLALVKELVDSARAA